MSVDLVRDAAIDVILRVIERGVHLDISLDKTIRRKAPPDRGRRFLTQLAYGTIRHLRLCDYALQPLCHQPIADFPPAILAVLRMGIFQSLFCTQVTHPAMVHTSVDLAKRRGHAGLARLVNAVLRRAPQRIDDVRLPDSTTEFRDYLGVRYSLPDWLTDLWISEQGESGARVLAEACNEPAPLTLRTNTLRTSRAELVARLLKSGHAAEECAEIPEAIRMEGGSAPLRSNWFREGHFMPQDTASMFAAHLLEPKPGERVLDLCAAPGGKATHLAQLAGGAAFIAAMDAHAGRLRAVQENVQRLGTPGVTVVCGDGVHAPFRGGFDAVLVDAPCSGLGTLRRHPDLKWRMTPEAIGRLAEQQRALLRSAVGLCENGGRIVYSVCTFTRQETEDVVRAVVGEGGVHLEDGPELLTTWRKNQGQYQTLPCDGALDGFFLTRLRKAS